MHIKEQLYALVDYGRTKWTKLWTCTQMSRTFINNVNLHKCTIKHSQRKIQPRTKTSNLANEIWNHKNNSNCHTRTIVDVSHMQVEVRTQTSRTCLRGGGVQRISMLIYSGLQIKLYFVRGGVTVFSRISVLWCYFPYFARKARFTLFRGHML